MRGQHDASTGFSTPDRPDDETAPRLMTVKEVSERLRLSPTKVYALTQSGELECYRFGRSIRVDEEQLRSFLDEAKAEVTRFRPSQTRHF